MDSPAFFRVEDLQECMSALSAKAQSASVNARGFSYSEPMHYVDGDERGMSAPAALYRAHGGSPITKKKKKKKKKTRNRKPSRAVVFYRTANSEGKSRRKKANHAKCNETSFLPQLSTASQRARAGGIKGVLEWPSLQSASSDSSTIDMLMPPPPSEEKWIFKREEGRDGEELIEKINKLEKLLPRDVLMDYLGKEGSSHPLGTLTGHVSPRSRESSQAALDGSMFTSGSSEFTVFSSLTTSPSVDVLPTKFQKPASMVDSLQSRPAFSGKLLQPQFSVCQTPHPFEGRSETSLSSLSTNEARIRNLPSLDLAFDRSLDFDFDAEADHAALRIQTIWRMYVDYWFVWGNSGVFQQYAATEFQRIYRGHRIRVYLIWYRHRLVVSATRIQRAFRAYNLKRQQSAICIQKWRRGCIGRARYDVIYERMHVSATAIQALARGFYGRACAWLWRTYRNNLRIMNVQRAARGHRGRQLARARRHFLAARKALQDEPLLIYETCRACVSLYQTGHDWRILHKPVHSYIEWGTLDKSLASMRIETKFLLSCTLFYVQDDDYCLSIVPKDDVGYVTFVRRAEATRNKPIFLIATAFERKCADHCLGGRKCPCLSCGWTFWGIRPRTNFYNLDACVREEAASAVVVEAFEPTSMTCFPSIAVANGVFDEALYSQYGNDVTSQEPLRQEVIRKLALRSLNLKRTGVRSFHKEHEVRHHDLLFDTVRDANIRLWQRRAATSIQALFRRCLANHALERLKSRREEQTRQRERVQALLKQRRRGKKKMQALRCSCAMMIQSRIRGWRHRTRQRKRQVSIRDFEYPYVTPQVAKQRIAGGEMWDYSRGACIRNIEKGGLPETFRMRAWLSGGTFEVRAYQCATSTWLSYCIPLADMLYLLLKGPVARLSNMIVSKHEFLRTLLGWFVVKASDEKAKARLCWGDWLARSFETDATIVNRYASRKAMPKFVTPPHLAAVVKSEKKLLKDCSKEARLAVAFSKKQRTEFFKIEKSMQKYRKELQEWTALRAKYLDTFSLSPSYTKEEQAYAKDKRKARPATFDAEMWVMDSEILKSQTMLREYTTAAEFESHTSTKYQESVNGSSKRLHINRLIVETSQKERQEILDECELCWKILKEAQEKRFANEPGLIGAAGCRLPDAWSSAWKEHCRLVESEIEAEASMKKHFSEYEHLVNMQKRSLEQEFEASQKRKDIELDYFEELKRRSSKIKELVALKLKQAEMVIAKNFDAAKGLSAKETLLRQSISDVHASSEIVSRKLDRAKRNEDQLRERGVLFSLDAMQGALSLQKRNKRGS